MKKNKTAAAPVAPVKNSEASGQNQKLSVEEFVCTAIDKLADPGRQTVHTVYSGFNDAFRNYFGGKDPIAEVKALVEAGKISFRFCRGGALIAKPGVIGPNKSDPKKALKKMGLS